MLAGFVDRDPRVDTACCGVSTGCVGTYFPALLACYPASFDQHDQSLQRIDSFCPPPRITFAKPLGGAMVPWFQVSGRSFDWASAGWIVFGRGTVSCVLGGVHKSDNVCWTSHTPDYQQLALTDNIYIFHDN